jgi:hypothetical protein
LRAEHDEREQDTERADADRNGDAVWKPSVGAWSSAWRPAALSSRLCARRSDTSDAVPDG